MGSITAVQKLHNHLGQIRSKLHGNRKRPFTYNGESDVSKLTPSVLIRSSSNLHITRTGIQSWMSLNFGQIGSLPSKLGALERQNISHIILIGTWFLQATMFIFDRTFVKLAGNQDRYKMSDEFEFRPDRISHFGLTRS